MGQRSESVSNSSSFDSESIKLFQSTSDSKTALIRKTALKPVQKRVTERLHAAAPPCSPGYPFTRYVVDHLAVFNDVSPPHTLRGARRAALVARRFCRVFVACLVLYNASAMPGVQFLETFDELIKCILDMCCILQCTIDAR